jgi:translation initiation factor 2 subunit 2
LLDASKPAGGFDMDYEKLLQKARASIPKEVFERKRFDPEKIKADSFVQGNRTILTNLSNIANYLNRDVGHILKFLLRELATSGNIEGSRAVFTGTFRTAQINEKIGLYVKEFVLCRTCNSPDTKLVKEEGIDYMKCMACQARRPVATLK